MMCLPSRLAASPAGWTTYTDVVVVNSGIAGLRAALQLRGVGSLMVVTKDILSAGSTRWAQGGIPAALHPEDTPEQHLRDTLVAGAGLCDEVAFPTLDRAREVVDTGVDFLAVGALTHSAPVLDIAMDLRVAAPTAGATAGGA